MKFKPLFISLCVSTLISCSYHFYSKEEAIKLAKKRDYKKYGSIVIEDDNEILKVLVRDSNFQKMDEIYHFSEDGKQIKYTLIASCDSCFQKFLFKIITSDKFKWRKLNDSTYYSKYSFKRILNIHKSTYSFDIIKHNQSKIECELLLKNAEK